MYHGRKLVSHSVHAMSCAVCDDDFVLRSTLCAMAMSSACTPQMAGQHNDICSLHAPNLPSVVWQMQASLELQSSDGSSSALDLDSVASNGPTHNQPMQLEGSDDQALSLMESESEQSLDLSPCVGGSSVECTESDEDAAAAGLVEAPSQNAGSAEILRSSEEKLESLAEEFRWAFHTFHALVCLVGYGALQSSAVAWTLACSTHFSGMGTVEVALSMLSVAATAVLGKPLQLLFLSACETNRKCQSLLQEMLPGCHVFNNILDRVVLCEETSYDVLLAALPSLRTLPVGFCVAHNAFCTFGHAFMDVAGTPCQLWSRKGKRLGRRDRRIVLLIVWCLIHRNANTPLLVHENVMGFDARVLFELMADKYEIRELLVRTREFGFSYIRRPRVYHILALRGVLAFATCPCQLFTSVAQRLVAGLPRASLTKYFFATDEEATRANFRQKKLTSHQARYLRIYTSMWQDTVGTDAAVDPRAVFDLSQNPEKRRVWSYSSVEGFRLPTFTRTSIFWVPALRRFMLPMELASAIGLPCHPYLLAASGLRQHMPTTPSTQMLGNAMHVASVGLVLSVALSSVRAG